MEAVVHDHVSATDTVSVTHDVQVFVDLVGDCTNVFNAVYLLSRSISISAENYYRAAAEHSLEQRALDLLIGDLVKIDLVLMDVVMKEGVDGISSSSMLKKPR